MSEEDYMIYKSTVIKGIDRVFDKNDPLNKLLKKELGLEWKKFW